MDKCQKNKARARLRQLIRPVLSNTATDIKKRRDMKYGSDDILKKFQALMNDVKKSVPGQYEAFIQSKNAMTGKGRISQKMKWLLLLVAGVSQKCPVCIPRAVKHCLDAGWSKDEMIEACMVAVLVGGASFMTYAMLAVNSINKIRR
jgi:alkylhydroperoxidase/carboxymuconolactone decarboxylase family protein YurZ